MEKSLRQKRSVKLKISAPTLISAPAAATANAVDISSSRPAGIGPGRAASLRLAANGSTESIPRSFVSTKSKDDRTADLVKRRYSTRFNNPGEVDGLPVPAVPTIPSAFASSGRKQSRDGDLPTAGRTLKIEPGVMGDANYRAEEYITGVLSDASEQEIDQYQRDLRQFKNKIEVDLQHNVFANRTSFITIGKEAESVRGEMRTMRGLITEMTNAMGQISATSGGDSFLMPARGRGNRSSVANLEALWNSHLQQLWKRVEGTQKFLPAIPGRHVVYESGKWVELNSATWKPRRRVHIILLNDHFVIAGEKKRGADVARDPKDKTQSAPLALIKCWPLQDVRIMDLPQKAGAGNAMASTSINVRVGAESMTFATENQDVNEKLTLLSNFRKAFEDLRKNLELETQDQVHTKETSNGLASPAFKTSFFGEYTFSNSASVTSSSKADIFVDVDGKPQSLRQVETEVDDLNIKIALQSFDEAVELTEKLRRVVKSMNKGSGSNSMNGNIQGAPVVLARKLDESTGKLANVLLRYLAESHSWMGSTRKNVDWLTRLGYEDRAREAYLDARTEVIQKRIRQVIFDGDLHLYIFQISYIYFSMIKHTAVIFQACFPVSMLSACVKWAKMHVDGFNALLERQLSSVDSSSETYKACMNRAREHAAMLGEVGLDFKDLVGRKSTTKTS